MLILMLKNEQVYNVTTGEVLNISLLPRWVKLNPCREYYNEWWHSRKSNNSNVSGRLLSSRAFANNKKIVDITTRGLSLTDSYWLKSSEECITFEQVSPYHEDFWKGEGVYSNQSIPTLYVDGFLNKYWESSKRLVKPYNRTEYEAYRLGKGLGLNCAEHVLDDSNLITTNFTDKSTMLETAMHVPKYREGVYDTEDIITDFDNGLDIIVLEAIIGNGDRHPGNYGYLVSTDTNQIKGSAPIYDFDHALDSVDPKGCPLIQEVLNLANSRKYDSHVRLKELCEYTMFVDTLPEFIVRAKYILSRMQ